MTKEKQTLITDYPGAKVLFSDPELIAQADKLGRSPASDSEGKFYNFGPREIALLRRWMATRRSIDRLAKEIESE